MNCNAFSIVMYYKNTHIYIYMWEMKRRWADFAWILGMYGTNALLHQECASSVVHLNVSWCWMNVYTFFSPLLSHKCVCVCVSHWQIQIENASLVVPHKNVAMQTCITGFQSDFRSHKMDVCSAVNARKMHTNQVLVGMATGRTYRRAKIQKKKKETDQQVLRSRDTHTRARINAEGEHKWTKRNWTSP